MFANYALKREILVRFDTAAKFYSVYEDIDGAAWFVQLYPSDIDDFAEIGCYTAVLSAETGEAIQLLSAADSNG
jgi:methyl coenzyme M reductase subunit C